MKIETTTRVLVQATTILSLFISASLQASETITLIANAGSSSPESPEEDKDILVLNEGQVALIEAQDRFSNSSSSSNPGFNRSGTFLNKSGKLAGPISPNFGVFAERGVLVAGPLTVEVVAVAEPRLDNNYVQIQAFATLTVYSEQEWLATRQGSGVSTEKPEHHVPSNAVVIPSDAAGPVQILLETSTDLVNWNLANPGTYGSSSAGQFFRVRAVAE